MSSLTKHQKKARTLAGLIVSVPPVYILTIVYLAKTKYPSWASYDGVDRGDFLGIWLALIPLATAVSGLIVWGLYELWKYLSKEFELAFRTRGI